MEDLSDSVEEPSSEKTLEEVIYGEDVSESTVDTVERWGQYKDAINWEEVATRAQKQVWFFFLYLMFAVWFHKRQSP